MGEEGRKFRPWNDKFWRMQCIRWFSIVAAVYRQWAHAGRTTHNASSSVLVFIDFRLILIIDSSSAAPLPFEKSSSFFSPNDFIGHSYSNLILFGGYPWILLLKLTQYTDPLKNYSITSNVWECWIANRFYLELHKRWSWVHFVKWHNKIKCEKGIYRNFCRVFP